ncbi:hypothetical protein BJX61DRAFT_515852 [Aspergillus egyptiacus]|nr:hypothetical protein BJX61DRAFT_515852 [Aspergillus egyptiacus]
MMMLRRLTRDMEGRGRHRVRLRGVCMKMSLCIRDMEARGGPLLPRRAVGMMRRWRWRVVGPQGMKLRRLALMIPALLSRMTRSAWSWIGRRALNVVATVVVVDGD